MSYLTLKDLRQFNTDKGVADRIDKLSVRMLVNSVKRDHPSDEQLSVYAEGKSDLLFISDHLNFCPRCYAIVHDTRETLREMRDSNKG